MPVSCCVVGCANRKLPGSDISFFRIPANVRQRCAWVNAIARKNWQPKSWERVCSRHFVTGWPWDDRKHVDYRPTLLMRGQIGVQTSKVVSGRRQRVTRRGEMCHLQELVEVFHRAADISQQEEKMAKKLSLSFHDYCVNSACEKTYVEQEQPEKELEMSCDPVEDDGISSVNHSSWPETDTESGIPQPCIVNVMSLSSNDCDIEPKYSPVFPAHALEQSLPKCQNSSMADCYVGLERLPEKLVQSATTCSIFVSDNTAFQKSEKNDQTVIAHPFWLPEQAVKAEPDDGCKVYDYNL